MAALWPAGSASLLRSLLVDGIIGGVGGVLVFLPNILLLFLGLAFLEDTGYMARAAFLIDRVMHRFGLHGKSFIPMLTGFGCSVPGIMATRTLENERDRLVDHAGAAAHVVRGAPAHLDAAHPGVLPARLARADAVAHLRRRHRAGAAAWRCCCARRCCAATTRRS